MNKIIVHADSVSNAKHYIGVFDNVEEAEAYLKKLEDTKKISQSSISFNLKGYDKDYGIYEHDMDVDKFFDNLTQWAGDYKFSGRD